MSRATSHAVVTELLDRGWATRHPGTGAIGLGPGFLTVSRAALDADHLGQWASPVLHRLADTQSMPCFLARRIGEDAISIVDHVLPEGVAGTATGDDQRWFQPGRRIRLRPPISREFIAWESEADRASWLDRAHTPSRTRLSLVLDAVRARGYSIERMTDDHVAMVDALGAIDSMSETLRTRVGDLLAELTTIDYLDDELIGEVSAVTVGAPIFDTPHSHSPGHAVAAIVSCPARHLPAAELQRIGEATRAAADEVSAQLR